MRFFWRKRIYVVLFATTRTRPSRLWPSSLVLARGLVSLHLYFSRTIALCYNMFALCMYVRWLCCIRNHVSSSRIASKPTTNWANTERRMSVTNNEVTSTNMTNDKIVYQSEEVKCETIHSTLFMGKFTVYKWQTVRRFLISVLLIGWKRDAIVRIWWKILSRIEEVEFGLLQA